MKRVNLLYILQNLGGDDMSFEEIPKTCPICKAPALKGDWIPSNRLEYICSNYKHHWHRCAIHGILAIGRCPVELEIGVKQKDLKQKHICSCHLNDPDIKRIYPFIEDKEVLLNIVWRLKKVKKQAEEITTLNEVLRQKNLNLDALHFIWCSGGCEGGHNRYGETNELTKEIIKYAEHNVKRMKTYYKNRSKHA